MIPWITIRIRVTFARIWIFFLIFLLQCIVYLELVLLFNLKKKKGLNKSCAIPGGLPDLRKLLQKPREKVSEESLNDFLEAFLNKWLRESLIIWITRMVFRWCSSFFLHTNWGACHSWWRSSWRNIRSNSNINFWKSLWKNVWISKETPGGIFERIF